MQPHAAGPTPPPPAGALSVATLATLVLLASQGAGAVPGAATTAVATAPPSDLDAYAGTGCMFEGARYRPGQAVPVKDEPCLRCRCRRGAPVCRLRVCAPLPDPPPPGCVLLHRANTCCPELHCPEIGVVDNRLEARHGQSTRYRSDAPNKGCYLNGSLFAEGSALSSSTLCDYCYCVRGQQRCVRPQCVLPAPGCTPEYRDHTCCPTSYHCGGSSTSSNSSSSSTSQPPRRRPSGCTVDGQRYRDGAQVKSVARGRCETCFCMRGRVRCAPLKCDLPLDGCEPVTAPGKCCPVSYDCSKSRVSITKTVTASSGHKTKGSIGRPPNGDNSVRSISFDARSNREISSKDTGKVKNEMERSEQNVVLTTQPPLPDESPTTLMTGIADNIAITLNTKLDLGDNLDLLKIKNNTVFPEKNKIMPVIEALINKTRQKDQDYDYDYNEPSLPPSLPNLRIIPFVAADAVVHEDKTRSDGGQILPESSNDAISKESQDKIDNFYFFSPPTETEGGFVPREPVIDGPFYQHKPDNPKKEIGHKVTPVKVQPPEVTVRTVIPDAVTPDPLLGNGGSAACTSGGRRYRHGELLTGMGACRMCFCFDGGIVCQEPSCGVVPPGCSRAPSRDPERCCGSITCEGDESRDRPLLFSEVPDTEPHRQHSKIPESPSGIEPVSDLVHSSTTPPQQKTTTTTTTTSTTAATTSVAPSTTTTTVKSQRRKTTATASTTTTTSTTTSTPVVKSTAKPALKTKTTTTKPGWTTKRPAPSTTRTTAPSSTPASTAGPPARPTTPKTTPTTPQASMATSTVTRTTPAPVVAATAATQKTVGPLANASTTLAPPPSSTTLKATSTTATTRAPVRKERPTTTPTSLFDALWGSEDESENEAQDKVDEDVEYHDFVSTNEHEAPAATAAAAPKPQEEAEEDAFSFDKFLELFIQPDPAPTTPPPLKTAAQAVASTTSTPSTTKRPPTTSKPSTTTKPSSTTKASTTTSARPSTTKAPLPSDASSKAKPSSTTRAPTTTTLAPTPQSSTTTRVTTSSTTPASLRTTQAKPTPTPPRATTPRTPSPPSPPPTKKTPTTPKPKPSPAAKPANVTKPSTTSPPVAKPAKTTTRPASTTTRRPSTTARVTTTATATPTTTSTSTSATPPTATSTTLSTTTSTAPPSTTTPAAVATMRPSLLFGSTKFRPSFLQDALASLSGGGSSSSSSSYPAQQHHMSTRRPAPTTTAAPAAPAPPPGLPAGLSGLLKLAGCNIYGRMYRVGKIIQELSGPCLECRCTEVGVQCQQLSC